MSDTNDTLCTATSCDEKAATYCEYLEQFFCEKHQEVHDSCASKPHKDIPITLYQQRQQEEKFAKYCEKKDHTKHKIKYACVKCDQLLCSQCMDIDVVCPQASLSGKAETFDRVLRTLRMPSFSSHKPESLKAAVKKIRVHVESQMSRTRNRQFQVLFALEDIQKTVDKLLDYDRDTLDEIDRKIGELELSTEDKRVKDFKQTHIKDMEHKHETLKSLEAEAGEFEKKCKEACRDLEELLEQSDVVILRNAEKAIKERSYLVGYKLSSFEFEQKQLSRAKNDHFPLSFRIIYEMVQGRFGIEYSLMGWDEFYLEWFHTTDCRKICSSMTYNDVSSLREKELIRSGYGDIYNFCKGGTVTNMCHFNDLRYVTQCSSSPYVSDANYYVHVLNLRTKELQVKVITVENIRKIVQVAATSKYICLTLISYKMDPEQAHSFGENDNKCKSAVKVYSATDFSYKFDILRRDNQDKEVHCHPCGIVALDDESLVFGDMWRNTVTNMTISRKPQVKWTINLVNTGYTHQTSNIAVDRESHLIFVARANMDVHMDSEPVILVLSYQGMKIGRIPFPRAPVIQRIYDISFYSSTMVVIMLDGHNKYATYEYDIPEYQALAQLTKPKYGV